MFRIHSKCSSQASLSRLSLELRTTFFHHHPRLFHASPSRLFQIHETFSFVPPSLENALKLVPYGLLEGVHFTTGLPWGFAIPAVAILVRIFVIYPWIVLPMRRARQTQMDLIPLEQAMNNAVRWNEEAKNFRRMQKYQPQIEQGKNVKKNGKKPKTLEEMNKGIKESQARYKAALQRRFKSQNWRTKLWIWQLGEFWAVGEAIRSMAGYKSSFLGMCLDPWTRLGRTTAQDVDSMGHSPVAAEKLAEGGINTEWSKSLFSSGSVENRAADILEATNDNVIAQNPPNELIATRPLPHEVRDIGPETATGSFLTPSLANEGLLWFQDLAVPDPLFILPSITASLIAINFWSLQRRAEARKRVDLGEERHTIGTTAYRIYRRSQVILVFAVLSTTATSMPAGFLLYWASSTVWAILQAVYMERRYPWKKPAMACKRVIRERS